MLHIGVYLFIYLTAYQHIAGSSEKIMVFGARLSCVHLGSVPASYCHRGESVETSVNFSFLVCEVGVMKIKLPQRGHED